MKSDLNPNHSRIRKYALHPQFALFLVVGTERIDVVRGFASAPVVSRVMAVYSSHIKGGGVARRRQCILSLERYREICNEPWERRDWSESHRPQVRTSRFVKPHAVETRLYMVTVLSKFKAVTCCPLGV
ncbi:hypothetical protein AVEN_33231-1 [Araneus ventricosus]|uniref:Uncharacterized protein n=1 Tax=Araneus ventricosus TaxID=182803 RepID=A0A4Y2SZL9_ARAVE|nr:hypothetical protein AVEN_33231-1 [Araneus ventricosus]